MFGDKQKRNLRRRRTFRYEQLSKLKRKLANSSLVPSFEGFTKCPEKEVQEVTGELAKLYFDSEVKPD